MFRKRQIPVLCSFCGKTAEEARKLVAGPGVYICDTCVVVCGKIIAGELEHPVRVRKVFTFARLRLYDPGHSSIEAAKEDQNG